MWYTCVGKKQTSKSKRRAEHKAPVEMKIASPPPAAAHQSRRTSHEIEEMFAALVLLPTSSPLPPRPRIRTEEELVARAEGWLRSSAPMLAR